MNSIRNTKLGVYFNHPNYNYSNYYRGNRMDHPRMFHKYRKYRYHLDRNTLSYSQYNRISQVKTVLKSMKNASFTLLQTVYRDGEKLFVMEIQLVHLSHEGTIVLIPDEERNFLLGLSE